MVGIENWDGLPLSNRNGTYGGQAGLKTGVKYHDENWMIKMAKNTNGMEVDDISYTTSPLSEFLGSHIYAILGYDVHETRLVQYRGKIAVACRDFRKDDELLLEIRTIKNAANEELADKLDHSFSSTDSEHMIQLEELFLHMKYNDILASVCGLKERFWDCVVVDALINNNDRNNGNWGILRFRGKDRLAPIFDNGAAFSNKMSEDAIAEKLKDKEKLRNSVLNTATTFQLNNKPLTIRKLFSEKCPLAGMEEYKDFNAAVLRNIPLIVECWGRIAEMFGDLPEIYDSIPVCSREREEFYLLGMRYRMDELMLPYYHFLKMKKKE